MRTFCLRGVLAFSIAFYCCTAAFGQGSTAAVSGRVTDAGGLVVIGAQVQAVNTATNLATSAQTNDDGIYSLPSLIPGPYKFTVQKDGFQQIIREGIELHVADAVALNFTLQVGSVSQSVTVTGEAPAVDTTTSSLGGLVNSQKMEDLPLNGRSFVDLSLLQPGVAKLYFGAGSSSGGSHGTAGTWSSSNGAPVRSNAYLLDGANMQGLMGGAPTSQVGVALGADGIQEYKVVTTGYNAEYGGEMGSHTIIATKGGTNQWHGDAFEFLRNSALDARNFFDYGYLNPNSGVKRLPEYRRNNFGGAFGGPIQKDKTFFYAVYEGLRQSQPSSIIDNTLNANCIGPAGAVVWNGLTTTSGNGQPAGSQGPCTQLLANPAGANTNSVTINSIVAPLLKLYQPANLPNNQFTYSANNLASVDYGQMRVDRNFSASDSAFARYTIDNGYVGSAGAFPETATLSQARNQYMTIAENHIFSPTILNTARLSVSRGGPVQSNVQINYPGIGPLTAPQYQLVPGQPLGGITVTTLTGAGENSEYGPPVDSERMNTYTLSDDLYYTHGVHSFKFGVLINRYNLTPGGVLRPNGQLTFKSVANFLQGQVGNWASTQPGGITDHDYFYNTLGFYGQDDWRLTPRLTLNLGLRYEPMTTITEVNNRGSAFRGTPGRISPTDTNAAPGVLNNFSLRDVSPRVGFAFDPTGSAKTSIHGAFGIYYDVANLGVILEQNELGTPPGAVGCSDAFSPLYTLTVLPIPSTLIGNCSSIYSNAYNAQQPYSMQYNLTVERQLPGNITVSLAFVGMRGVHLWFNREGNPVQVPMAESFVGGQYVPGNTYYTTVQNGIEYYSTSIIGATQVPDANGNPLSASIPGCANSNPAVQPTCRINPLFDSANFTGTTGSAIYNSLQLNVTKRLGRGLQFQGSYTYSNAMDDGQASQTSNDCGASSYASDPLVYRTDYGPSCTDVRNLLRFNMLYHFPKINSSNRFVSQMANGWWLASIVAVQSGFPFTPQYPSSTIRSQSGSNTSYPGDRPDFGTATVAPGQTGPNGQVNTTSVTFIPYNPATVITGNPQQWFNPLMFMMQPIVVCPGDSSQYCGTLGTVSRNSLRQPGLGNWDFTLAKDTRLPMLGEAGNLAFRAEFFNLLNRANFGGPSIGTFTGTTKDLGSYSEAPISTAGQITSTLTTAREIQLSLKIIF